MHAFTQFLIVALSLGQMDSRPVSAERRLVELAWEDVLQSDAGWKREPWLVGNPDDASVAAFGPDGATFQVVAGKAMAWTRTINPVWTAHFPWVKVEYTAGGDPTTSLLLSDDSTGPITPGALNMENPLASGGRLRLELSPKEDHLLVNLREQYKSDRVARISLLVSPGKAGGETVVQLKRISFWASDPGASALKPATAPAERHLFAPSAASRPVPVGWTPIELPAVAPAVSVPWLARAFGCTDTRPDGDIGLNDVAFRLAPPDQAALATGIMETTSLELAGTWRGSELALLMGARRFGGGSPWPGQAKRTFTTIASPHHLVVRLKYRDGTRRSAFPWSVARRDWSVEGLPQPYLVALDPARELVGISVDDRMNDGQVFLLAASVRTGSQPPLGPSEPARLLVQREAPRTGESKVALSCDEHKFELATAALRMKADVTKGVLLEQLRLAVADRELLTQPVPMVALSTWKGQPIALTLKGPGEIASTQPSADVSRGEHVQLAWAAGENHTVRLDISSSGAGFELTPTLINDAEAAWQVSLTCPQLTGCRVSDQFDDRWYLLGSRSTTLDRRPIKLDLPYCGDFPLQLIDLFAPQANAGLGMIVRDRNLQPKVFHFKQAEAGTEISVEYPRLTVPARGQLPLPTTQLLPHGGDWHPTFAAYREEVRGGALLAERQGVSRAGQGQSPSTNSGGGRNSVMGTVPVGASPLLPHEPVARMRGLFYCRRDYPLGGTDYLFDARNRCYTPAALIAESRRGLGGIDMIDISGWAYHEATGRVGDYVTNDLGGLEELRRGVAAAHAAGARVGLYTEGYLIDRRAPIAAKALPAWQIIDKNGKPKWWSGEMEFFACPGVEEWREEFSRQLVEAVRGSGTDAIYVDEFGFCGADKACWSPNHGHPVPSNPMLEESRMLTAIRKGLDREFPRVGIYIEQVPCDAMIPLVDAAFNYGMETAGPHHATKLPLHRFVFPELVSVEMLSHGIRPAPVDADDLHRCIFHGVAIWLKGRSESWYDPDFRETAVQAHRILRTFWHTFYSPDCEPLVPTLAGEIYANRFGVDLSTRNTGAPGGISSKPAPPNPVILTFYNARFTDYTGPLIRTLLPGDWTVRDLWNERHAEFHRDISTTAAPQGEPDMVVLNGHLEPRSVGIFLLAPREEEQLSPLR